MTFGPLCYLNLHLLPVGEKKNTFLGAANISNRIHSLNHQGHGIPILAACLSVSERERWEDKTPIHWRLTHSKQATEKDLTTQAHIQTVKYADCEYLLLRSIDPMLDTTLCDHACLTWPGDYPGTHSDRSGN